MHIENGLLAGFLDRQSLGAVIFSALLTITLVAAIYFALGAR